MGDSEVYIEADGTILRGEEAEKAKAMRDAKEIMEELGTAEGAGSSKTANLEADCKEDSKTGEEPKELAETLKNVGPDIMAESESIWKFSREVGTNIYHFSLDLDRLFDALLGPVRQIQAEINMVGGIAISILTNADNRLIDTMETLETWADMAENIRRGASKVKSSASQTADKMKQFTGGLNEKAQKLASTIKCTVENPMVKNFVDLSDVTDAAGGLAGFVDEVNSQFGDFMERQVDSFKTKVDEFSSKLIEYGEKSGVFYKLREAAKKICNLLKKISRGLDKFKNMISSFLGKFNNLLGKIFMAVAKIQSFIECFGLDVGLLKEALRNGTIRPTDIQLNRRFVAENAIISPKSSCKISGAKLTGCNTSVVRKVMHHSNSGHIDVVGAEATFLNADLAFEREGNSRRHTVCAKGVDVTVGNIKATVTDKTNTEECIVGFVGAEAKLLNADVAVKREGKYKRKVTTTKGLEANIGNVNATLVDDREGEETVAEIVGGQLNAFNVDFQGLGRKGTRTGITRKASVSVGNVAIGIRRHREQVINTGPSFSEFNLDLTIGPPSWQNFTNQLQAGASFTNFSIPFFGGGVTGGNGAGNGGDDEDQTNGNEANNNGEKESDGIGTNGNGRFNGHKQGNREHRDTLRTFEIRAERRGIDVDEGGSGGGGRESRSTSVNGGVAYSTTTRRRAANTATGSDTTVRRDCTATGDVRMHVKDDWSNNNFTGNRNRDGNQDDIKTINRSRAGVAESMPTVDNYGGHQHTSTERGQRDMKGENFGGEYTTRNVQLNCRKSNKSYSDQASKPSNTFASDDGCDIRSSGNASREGKMTDAYQDTLAAAVRPGLGSKLDYQVRQTGKENEKQKPTCQKPLSKSEFKDKIRKEYKEIIGNGSSESASPTGSQSEKEPKTEKPKPKCKPWGPHGNIHGFSSLSMDSDKEIKKFGNVYGFKE